MPEIDHDAAISYVLGLADEAARITKPNWESEIRYVAALASQAKKMEEALRAVKYRRPQVCENFEMCDHIGCTASYEAFAIADAALAALEKKP